MNWHSCLFAYMWVCLCVRICVSFGVKMVRSSDVCGFHHEIVSYLYMVTLRRWDSYRDA